MCSLPAKKAPSVFIVPFILSTYEEEQMQPVRVFSLDSFLIPLRDRFRQALFSSVSEVVSLSLSVAFARVPHKKSYDRLRFCAKEGRLFFFFFAFFSDAGEKRAGGRQGGCEHVVSLTKLCRRSDLGLP